MISNENLYNEISLLKQALNEFNEYFKKQGKEISFYLNCINIGLNSEEIADLFSMYLQETKNLDINELEQIIVNPSYLINITKKHFSKVRYMNEEVIKNLVKSFVYKYTILNKKLIIS